MIRHTFHASLLAAGLLLAAMPPAQAQQSFKLTAAGGHPPVFLWVKLLDEFFIPEVDRRLAAAGGKVKVEWTKAWGGTLIKLGAESKGIADGVADVGFVGTIFEAARFPMQNVSYFTPFGSDNIATVTGIVADLQARIPAMGDAWTKNGLVYLGGAALDSYHIWTNFPIRSVDDLKGKKISAPGPAANWIRDTGAVAVAGSLNTYYEDIKSGVSNGAIVFSTGAWGAKLHEVAPHITKVNFGAMYAGGIAINKRRFDALPPEVQAVFREVGAEYSQRFAAAQAGAASALLAKMQEGGAKIAELSPAERKRWADTLPAVAKTWAADLQSKGAPGNEVLSGYIDGLKKAGTQLPRDWSAN
ncbi:MAG: C4-dicarboxylate TRAP transporter substrate-binding protein [Burkholderiaceae bacterium]|nr:C4-dicarboxylate TRAP transporter substrate-binding protein [Burkholderiaceae bacterium]